MTMKPSLLLAIDQGTTGTKVLLVNREGKVVAQSYAKHTQYYPRAGWVEHDPEEIWQTVRETSAEAMSEARANPEQIVAVGLANQGETVMWWDALTHRPLYRAVVWSCRRSQDLAERWMKDGDWERRVAEKTGLRIDPYFSATKIRWLLDHVPSVKEAVSLGRGRVGTMDSWLIWKMTAGASHVTDASTAARTLLFNIHTGDYDGEILAYLGLEREWLPAVLDSVHPVGSKRNAVGFGLTSPEHFLGIRAPIAVSLVDQPAALFGHLCLEPGSSKCTYGTGCFVYMNTGNQPPASTRNLLSTLVWRKDGKSTFALDGGVYSAGSSVEWAKDGLGLFPDLQTLQNWSVERLKENRSVTESEIFCIPALSGIGAPYWDSAARGAFLGLSYNTTRKEMALAVLEGIAHRVADVMESMEEETGLKPEVLRVDGGLTNNPYLMQFQADLLGLPVEVSDTEEATAAGVAYLLGIAAGWWTEADLKQRVSASRTIYVPRSTPEERREARKRWKTALGLVRQFPVGSDNVRNP